MQGERAAVIMSHAMLLFSLETRADCRRFCYRINAIYDCSSVQRRVQRDRTVSLARADFFRSV